MWESRRHDILVVAALEQAGVGRVGNVQRHVGKVVCRCNETTQTLLSICSDRGEDPRLRWTGLGYRQQPGPHGKLPRWKKVQQLPKDRRGDPH